MAKNALLQDLSTVLTRFRAAGHGEFAFLPAWFGPILQAHGIREDGFDPVFMAGLVYTGWFLFADRQLLPKFHARRAVLQLDHWDAASWRQQQLAAAASGQDGIALRSLKKQVARIHPGQYQLRIAEDFRSTLDEVNQFQRERMGLSWLSPPMVDALVDMHRCPVPLAETAVQAIGWDLWDTAQNRRVAADVGYQVGKVYASLSGYSDRRLPSIGIVQLLVQLEVLRTQGVVLWDLGMPMPYKRGLGAIELSGSAWIEAFHRHRDQGMPLQFSPRDPCCCGVFDVLRTSGDLKERRLGPS